MTLAPVRPTLTDNTHAELAARVASLHADILPDLARLEAARANDAARWNDEPYDADAEDEDDVLNEWQGLGYRATCNGDVLAWLTFGGPNIWIEFPAYAGNAATIGGAWGGGQVGPIPLTWEETEAAAELLGMTDRDDLAPSELECPGCDGCADLAICDNCEEAVHLDDYSDNGAALCKDCETPARCEECRGYDPEALEVDGRGRWLCPICID